MSADAEQQPADPVLVAQRQRDLLQRIRVAGLSHVNELTRAAGVSASTVRRDLADLERRGLVERVRGGAQAVADEPVRLLRPVAFADEKRRIGRAAAALVRPGQTLLVNGGTTTEAFVPFLHGIPGLTVLTSSLGIAGLLSQNDAVHVVVLGGVLRRTDMTLLGHLTIANLGGFDVDAVVSGAFGVDPDVGVTGTDLLDTQTERALTAVAPLVLLVHHGKFAQRGPVKLVPYDDLEAVVTDGPLEPALEERLAARRPRLVLA